MILGLFVASITGAALQGDTLYTWGDKLLAWTLPALTSRTIAIPTEPATAGCLDQDGTGLFLQEGNRLMYRKMHYREIYSFYSRSRQGGLLLTDVDGDGY